MVIFTILVVPMLKFVYSQSCISKKLKKKAQRSLDQKFHYYSILTNEKKKRKMLLLT